MEQPKYTHPTFKEIFDEIAYNADHNYTLHVSPVRQSKSYKEYACINKLYIYPDGTMQYKTAQYTYPKHLWTKVKKLAMLLEETEAEQVLYGETDQSNN